MIQSVVLAQVEPTARELPRWRGFNLLEMFTLGGSAGPFHEEDFQLISELGFNFVRLPMDYRIWIVNGNWTQFNDTALQWIDQAVEYGRRYGVHVCLNFHRAPGYTVATPPEPTSLWTDPRTQDGLRPALGRLRSALQGHPEQPPELQPAQRAFRRGPQHAMPR